MKKQTTFYFMLLLLFEAIAADAQTPTAYRKANEEYAVQKSLADELANKKDQKPFDQADWNTLVSLDKSGDGNISIPVTQVKGRKLTLPLTISYNTNGIKVTQQSSEVGLGWQLSTPSIVRDYGAFEPDYTYNGSEFRMKNHAQPGAFYDKKLWSRIYLSTGFTEKEFNPWGQNKMLEYLPITSGRSPDQYNVNIPGVISNSFWNADNTENTTPAFIFTEQSAAKIGFEKKTFTISQEISRINELSYLEQNGKLRGDEYNRAVAIAVNPYVKNQRYAHTVISSGGGTGSTCLNNGQYVSTTNASKASEAAEVTYEDYSGFTITQPDGTVYLFNRPLRGQKYLFSEEPHWSVIADGDANNPDNLKCKGEFWKTDYIAEWLLTEIHSADYSDANGNNFADDGDNGDWIKIEYTEPYQYEVPLGFPVALKVPKHREWASFSQTDRASSLMRERAYITSITTPVQKVDFSSSERFDVDFDYFKEVFNRVNNQFVYQQYNTVSFMSPISVDENMNPIPQQNIATTTAISYPVELKKYDRIAVKENISSAQKLVSYTDFNYAAKGSSQELAVSNYLIIDNNKNFTSYDLNNYGNDLVPSRFLKTTGRGKTTLLSLRIGGSDFTSSQFAEYKFEYGYNPSYNDLHLYEIQKMAAYPDIRESSNSQVEYWNSIRTYPTSPTTFGKIANSILPWKTIAVASSTGSGYGQIGVESTENWGNKVMSDELGHYYDANHILKGRNAWLLSAVRLPYGGKVSIEYDQDSCDITTDRKEWLKTGIADYALPSVAYYNNIGHIRNRMNLIGSMNPKTNRYSEYYYMMNERTGGVRIKQLSFYDPYANSSTVKRYRYGLGHYTAPPAEYWGNYLQGFSAFTANERLKHVYGEQYCPSYNTSLPWKFNEYAGMLLPLLASVRIDNSISRSASHYYEFIDEIDGDGGFIRQYQGAAIPDLSSAFPRNPYFTTGNTGIKGLNIYNGTAPTTGDRTNICELLFTNAQPQRNITNYKTEYYNASGALVGEKSTENEYAKTSSNSIGIAQQLIPPFVFHSWARYGYNCNLPGALEQLTPFETKNFLAQEIYTTEHSSMGYTYVQLLNTGRNSDFTLNSREEAKNPLFKILYGTGYYPSSTMPSWFTPIVQSPVPWQSSGITGIHNAFNWVFQLTRVAGEPVQNQFISHYGYEGNYYLLDGAAIESQQSYYLRPKSVKVIEKF